MWLHLIGVSTGDCLFVCVVGPGFDSTSPAFVSEMMNASGGLGSRWMTDLINNIVKQGCIPDDWREYPGDCVQGERRSTCVRIIQCY